MASRSIGTLTVDLLAKTFGFEQGMDRAAKTADKRMKEIERTALKFGAAVGTAITAVSLATKNAIDGMDDLSKAAQRANTTTETFSALAYAANLADVSIEDLQTSFGRLAKAQATALDENSKQAKVFDALGIATKDVEGNLRDTAEVFKDFADAFKDNQGSPEIIAAGMEIFGRSFQNLIPLLKDGEEGLNAAMQEAKDFGQVISTETGKQAEAFNDNLTRLMLISKGLANTFAAELLPDLVDVSGGMVSSAVASDDLTESIKDLAGGVGDLIKFAGQATTFLEGLRQTLVGLEKQGNAAFQSLNPANWTSGGLAALKAQYDAGTAMINDAFGGGTAGTAAAPSALDIDQQAIAAAKKAAQDAAKSEKDREAYLKALREALGGGGETKGGGKSDAQREAEQLQSAYESLSASLQENIALFGQESQAAKVAYDLENGSLKALDETRKAELLTLARQIDALNEAKVLREEEEELIKRENQRIEDGLKYGREVTESLEFEIELLGKSNREREKAITLSQLSAEARIAEGEAISRSIDRLYDEMDRIELMDGFRDSFQNFFADVISGTESVSDAFKNMLDDINAMILRRITENWVEQLFGAFGSNQGGAAGGNWFNMIAGIFGGGKASGGIAHANRLYEVNESGMEMASVNGRDYLLTGSKPVQITPNSGMGGMQQTNVFTIQGKIDRRTEDQIVQQVGRRTQMAMARNG